MTPLLSNTAGKAQHMPPPQPSTLQIPQIPQIPQVPLASETTEVHYLSDREQRDATLQVAWSTWMSDVQKNSSVYKHVFVLLVSWHPDCDDMSVDNEVTSLKEVLENEYHYNVSSFRIDSRKATSPQVQVNFEVAKFVHDNDQQDSLFIVYYAGHGSPGKSRGELKMSGRRGRKNTSEYSEWNHITWNLAESNLRSTQADVFLIFDCCHASDLGRESGFTSRCFEYLAASTSFYTASPGKRSFTSALIWALKELAGPGLSSPQNSQPAGRMFTTSRLAAKICEAPNFPPDQQPSLTTRDHDVVQRIVLAPLTFLGDLAHVVDDDDDDAKRTPEIIYFNFWFKTKQEEKELKKLADHLIKFVKFDDTSLYKVQWTGIRPPAHSRFRAVVNEVIARARPRRLSASNVSPSPPVVGRLTPPGGYATSDGLLTPTSATEHTPLLSDSFHRYAKDDAPKGPLNYLFSFFRTFWLPRIEVEGPADDRSASVSPRRPESRTGSLMSKIRGVLNGLLRVVRVRL